MAFEFEATKEQKKYLSHILTGTDDDAVFAAVERACSDWGLFPDSGEPTDAEYSATEAVATKIASVIREGLGDGSIKARAKAPSTRIAKPTTPEEEADDKVLTALGF